MNKKIITATIIFLGLGLVGFYLHLDIGSPLNNPHFICSHPSYALIEQGQTKDEITEILGAANEQIIKEDVSEYQFGQGENESLIKEGWKYKYDDWEGGIEIYFGVDEIVVGKNCGHG